MAESPQFFVDTSILVAHLRQQPPSVFYVAQQVYGIPIVSDIVVFEMEVGARRAGREFDFQTNFEELQTYALTQETLIQAAIIEAKLLQSNQGIGILDVFIAATALHYQLPLLSLNKKHFSRVEGLNLLSIPERK